MNDIYTEQLVKKQATMTDTLVKAAMILVIAISVVVVFFIPIALPAPIIAVVITYIMFKRLNLEYEYLFVNGDLDIDKIMSKEKRKKVFETSINDVEVVAKSGSPELSSFQNVKAEDFSSHTPGAKTYELVIAVKGQRKRIIFEPNESILNGMKMLAPRKVFL